jgi:predicted transcriptional regulator
MKDMEKRSRTEMRLAILDACKCRPMKVTHIMYQANVNASLLKEFLEELQEKGLLIKKSVGQRAFYRTTQKGFALLGPWRQIETVLVE